MPSPYAPAPLGACLQVNACIPCAGISPDSDVTALSAAERSADSVGVLAALCSLLPQAGHAHDASPAMPALLYLPSQAPTPLPVPVCSQAPVPLPVPVYVLVLVCETPPCLRLRAGGPVGQRHSGHGTRRCQAGCGGGAVPAAAVRIACRGRGVDQHPGGHGAAVHLPGRWGEGVCLARIMGAPRAVVEGSDQHSRGHGSAVP